MSWHILEILTEYRYVKPGVYYLSYVKPSKPYMPCDEPLIKSKALYLTIFISTTLAEIGIRVLFFLVAFVAAVLFEELASKLDRHLKQKSVEKISLKLERWREQYDLTCQFIDKLNKCFGFILLLMLAHALLFSMVSACKIIQGIMYYNGDVRMPGWEKEAFTLPPGIRRSLLGTYSDRPTVGRMIQKYFGPYSCYSSTIHRSRTMP